MSDIQIIQGDCLEVMKTFDDNQFDLVLTDPPYNIGFSYDKYTDDLSEEQYIEMLTKFQYPYRTVMIHYPEETMQYLVPALGVPDEVMVWCYNSNLPKQSRLINFFNCVPDRSKVKVPYKNLNDKRIIDYMKKGGEGANIYDWFSDIQQVKNVSLEKTEHPCPVPVKLMERVILMTTKEGDTVLDPFLGSGTTAVACERMGRNCVGIEISPEYCEIARKRVQEEKDKMGLFNGD